MAPVALNIIPGLRAWRQAGISHLLLDEDVAVALRSTAAAMPRPRRSPAAPSAAHTMPPSVTTSAPLSAPLSAARPAMTGGPHSPSVQQHASNFPDAQTAHQTLATSLAPSGSSSGTSSGTSSGSSSGSSGVPDPTGQTGTSQRPAPSPPSFAQSTAAGAVSAPVTPLASAASPAPASAAPLATAASPTPSLAPVATAGAQPLYPPQAWPEHWQTLLRSTPPTPVAVWTYPELGTDLRGQASPARRQILKNLLTALRMPTGSNAFWPYALPPEDAPNPSLFAAALEHLKPRTVLLLGEQAVSDLAPLGDLPTVLVRPVLCRGYRFILLPDMETLTALTAPRWDRLIAFVRASLS